MTNLILNNYHSSKIDKLEKTIDQIIQNYANLLIIIDFIKKNSTEWFSKYVDIELSNEKAIFSNINKSYIIAYWNSLKNYIWEIEKYVIKNNMTITKKGQMPNNQGIDIDFIKEIFNKLRDEVYKEINKLLTKTKSKIIESFKENWK